MGQIVVPSSGVKPGTVAYFAAANPPPGWLVCDGAPVSRQAYRALFDAIGTTFGSGNAPTNWLDDDVDAEILGGWSGPNLDLSAVNAGLVAPNNEPDAWKITATGTDTNARYQTSFTPGDFWPSGNRTISVFVRNVLNAGRVAMNVGGSQLGSKRIVFDLTTGLFVGASFTTVGTPYAVEDGDWLRCVWSENVAAAQANFRIAPATDFWGGPIQGAELGVWGLLIESGVVASEYYGNETFNLPDLRGCFIRSDDGGKGFDPEYLTRQFGSLQMDELREHSHDFPVHFNTIDQLPICGGSGSPWTTGSTAVTGGLETRPVNVNLLPCIKF